MSTPAYVDSETITQADKAQSSRVPVPLPDDPYVAVRQAQLVDTYTKSDPKEALSEAEESRPLGPRVPLISEEFEASEPSGTRTVSSHSLVSSDSTTPLSPDHLLTHVSPTPSPTRVSFHLRTTHMAVRTQPTLSLGMSARIAEATALSPSSFHKRYRSSYKTSSSSPTLQVWKRYQGTSKLILDTDSEGDKLGDEDIKEDEEDEEDKSLDADDERERSDEEGHGLGDEDHGFDDESQGVDDEGLGLEEEEAVLEVGEDQVPSTFEVDPKDDRVYTDIPAYVPLAAHVQTPPSPEWSLVSLPVSPSSPVVPSPIASLVATLTATISVDKDQFIEVGVQLELHGSILHDHTQRLDALPPTLVADIDRDMRELYTRSRAVRDEIFLHRPVLALEAWAGHVDTRLADMSWARYDDHTLIHDMLVQQAAMQLRFRR
ncbi:hypothetical protein Tco_0300720 [Tanacetum coccineum]